MSIEVVERLQKEIPDPTTRLQFKRRLDEDLHYLVSNMDLWRKQHPNRWIAVYNQELVAVADTQDRLLAILDDGEVPLAEALIDFVTEHPIKFVL